MKNGIKTSRFVVVSIAFICVLLMATLLGCAAKPTATTPIKIGILYPYTGPETWLGMRQTRGWELVFEQVNYTVAGRPVEFVKEDSQSDPKVAVTKVTKLIESDQVQILGGVVSSRNAYAIRDPVDRSKTPLVISMANAGGVTEDQRSPYIFRTFPAGATGSYYMAQYLYNELGVRTAVFSGVDYAYGHEHGEMFKAEFEKLGGKVLFENYAPFGTADYGPYVTELGQYADRADALHFVYSGADALRIVKALDEFGVKEKFKVLSNWGATSDGNTLAQEGPAAEGIYIVSTYLLAADYDANRHFLELEKQKDGQPWFDSLDAMGYITAQAVLNALEKVKGNVEDEEAFLKALREAKWESPGGTIWFDERSGNALPNLFIGQARKVNGEFAEYQNVIVHTYENVQDPWWLEHPQG